MAKPSHPSIQPEPGQPPSGLVGGGRGGPADELLEDGQEEVFSRYEVEHGMIEHHVEAGGMADPVPVKPRGS